MTVSLPAGRIPDSSNAMRHVTGGRLGKRTQKKHIYANRNVRRQDTAPRLQRVRGKETVTVRSLLEPSKKRNNSIPQPLLLALGMQKL